MVWKRSENVDGERLLEFADNLELKIASTLFRKDVKKLLTEKSHGHKIVTDYILVR